MNVRREFWTGGGAIKELELCINLFKYDVDTVNTVCKNDTKPWEIEVILNAKSKVRG